MLYAVNEIFYSLQGEGYWVGTPVVFVRFAGCNLNCSWCDTNFETKEELTVKEIMGRCLGLLPLLHPTTAPMVVFTGGEPTLQKHLWSLVDTFDCDGWFTAIESNGTNPISSSLAWVTISPKPGVEYDLPAVHGNELKIVLDGDIDPHAFDSCVFQHRFIQPCSGVFAPAVKFVKENPQWRLSLQTQKM